MSVLRTLIPSESERLERISAVLTYYDQIFSAQIMLHKHFKLSETKDELSQIGIRIVELNQMIHLFV